MLKLKMIGINLVSVVSHSNKSALGPTDDFLRAFDAVQEDLSSAELQQHAFMLQFNQGHDKHICDFIDVY